ncbi:MAG: SGNH/GDSL hydrolase family protein, partial [Candidatus Hydrogenedentes bacterium]|nr:SGNH/GDSL hydrolase family protein [Candidatus Hydrogenedentota bacterium]
MPRFFHDKEIGTLAWILSLCIALLTYEAIASSSAFVAPCALFLALTSPALCVFAAVAGITNLFLFIPFPTLGAYPFFALLGSATLSLFFLKRLFATSRVWPQAQLRSITSRRRVLACSVLLAASALLTAVPAPEALLWSTHFFLLALAAPQRAPKRNLNWTNAGILFVSLMLSVALLELGARVIAEPVVPSRPVYGPHPQYIYSLIPGRKWIARITETEGEPFVTESESSEQGINGSVVYGPKGEDEFRILMLGDSFTAGHGLVWEDTLGQALETLLAEESLLKRCVVINGGVGGYGPWQERGFLLERCLGFEPDLVIHQLFAANDVHDTLLQ